MSSIAGPHRKLALLLGMLGSEHDGERATAARMASEEVKRLGLTWLQVAERAVGVAAATNFPRPTPPPYRPSSYQNQRQQSQPPRYPQPGHQPGHQEGWEPQQRHGRSPPNRGATEGPQQRDMWRGWGPPHSRRTYNVGRKWSERDGIKLWHFCRDALRDYTDDLDAWELGFLRTFFKLGASAAGTEAQWAQIRRIARKLGITSVGEER